MRRILCLGVLALAGCQNLVGPFRPHQPQRIDDPNVSMQEQQRRGRAGIGFADSSPTVGPSSGGGGLQGNQGYWTTPSK